MGYLRYFSKLTLATLAITSVLRAQVLLDDFNRPDSTNLGANWTEVVGNISIAGGSATGTVDPSLMIFNDVSANAITADVFEGTGSLQYGALVVGYADVSNNLFVKVQGNGGAFNIAYFYYGNNGGAFGSQGASSSLVPFSSARLTLTLQGSLATLFIDTNFDGIPDQTISRPDVPTALLGSGIGLGFFGQAQLDNFELAAVPEPGVLPLLLTGLAVLGTGMGFRHRALKSGFSANRHA